MAEQVSVIIPTFNSGKYIEQAIASVAAQNFPNMEIIVVDDGSADDTGKLLEPYVARGEIKYIRQENKGSAAARNLGIKNSSGEFIAFLDADDLWMPNKLERQMPLFGDPTIGLVYSDTEIFGDAFKFKSHSEFSGFERGNVHGKLLLGNFVPTSSVVVRRSAIEKAGGFSEDKKLRLVEDYFLWLTVARGSKFEFSPERLIKYRIHAGQTSKRKAESYGYLCSLYSAIGAKNGYNSVIIRKYIENKVKFVAAKILG